MIQLEEIEVRGQSEAGPFKGVIKLSPGLQVVSARNAFGKSLAVKAIPWCLGVEPIFGIQDNDAACFPEAARDQLELPDGSTAKVYSSECSITFLSQDGSRMKLTRPIKGDSKNVLITESAADGEGRTSKLMARRDTMQDEHGGLQRFLFEILKWPRQEVTTFRGSLSQLYLENLVPTFYIDQNEGWTNVQALQISRYGQQQISEIAIEYVLGAIEAINARVLRQGSAQRSTHLRETARELAGRVEKAFLKRGWRAEWSGNGTIEDVVARWSARSLREVLKAEANVDLAATRTRLNQRIEVFRKALTSGPVDAANSSAPAGVSQRVIELKTRRHQMNVELNTLRTQYDQTSELLTSLDHRIQAATDLLRLKTTGVGRLDHVECPTCHRDLDPATFALSVQSEQSVSSHIEALKVDRDLVGRNRQSLEQSLATVRSGVNELDAEFREAERVLQTVTTAVGTIREQVAKSAGDLTAAERDLDRIDEISVEVEELQGAVAKWLDEARKSGNLPISVGDLMGRKEAFVKALRRYLIALGHSAVRNENVSLVHLDEQYVPYLGTRRLRALGSASDQSRLVAAYSLALAAASETVKGFHPGVVILDEPLQQNPDAAHKDLFLAFLSKQLARDAAFQTVIFTWLSDQEIELLRKQGTKVLTPEGHNFLQIQKPDPSVEEASEATAGETPDVAGKVETLPKDQVSESSEE